MDNLRRHKKYSITFLGRARRPAEVVATDECDIRPSYFHATIVAVIKPSHSTRTRSTGPRLAQICRPYHIKQTTPDSFFVLAHNEP